MSIKGQPLIAAYVEAAEKCAAVVEIARQIRLMKSALEAMESALIESAAEAEASVNYAKAIEFMMKAVKA